MIPAAYRNNDLVPEDVRLGIAFELTRVKLKCEADRGVFDAIAELKGIMTVLDGKKQSAEVIARFRSEFAKYGQIARSFDMKMGFPQGPTAKREHWFEDGICYSGQ